MKRFGRGILAGCILAGAAAFAGWGCGGGGGGSSDTGNVSAFLTDAPLIAVNGRNFDELNVDITSFEASVTGTSSFVPMTLATSPMNVNLLDLNNDQDWLAVATLPTGTYDRFRLKVDTTTAELVEQGTAASQPLVMSARNPGGVMEFRMHPPLRVDGSGAQHLIVIDWEANRSVRYEASSNSYILSGEFRAFAANRTTTPIPFRALPARLTAVDTSNGEMRIVADRHSAARYLVRTNPTSATPADLQDMQGNALTIASFQAGDFVIISGTIDGNADIDASRVRLLPSGANHAPGGNPGHGNHGGGNPGGGNNGGNPGGGNNTAPAGIVFAAGIVGQLDLTANTFTIRTQRGQAIVTYSEAPTSPATEIVDRTVRPAQAGNENLFVAPTTNGDVLVEVVGKYVAPTTAGGLPTIDCTRANNQPGRIGVLRRR